MRKVDPKGLCDDVVKEIDSLLGFYMTIVPALKTRPNRNANISLLSEVAFLQGYVAIESFLSDWFVGCINRKPDIYLKWLHNSVRQSAENKKGQWYVNNLLELKTPKHLHRSEIEQLLEPKGENATFQNFDTMEEKAKEWLSSTWASRIKSVPKNRRNILDTARAIRHFIAHQSMNSFRKMNDAIKKLPRSGAAAHLRLEKNLVKKAGSYLKAAKSGKSRVEIFFEEFKNLADNLNGKQ